MLRKQQARQSIFCRGRKRRSGTEARHKQVLPGLPGHAGDVAQSALQSSAALVW